MPVTIIVEDGSGLAEANSFVSVEDAESYFSGRLYVATWVAAGDDDKARALIMATRAINNAIQWDGQRGSIEQALEWPRRWLPRRDAPGYIPGYGFSSFGQYWPDDELPRQLVEATCEMALALFNNDRTADADTKGIRSIGLGNGAIDITFDPGDRPIALTDEVMRLLSVFGKVRGKGGMVRLTRVQ